MPLPRNKEVSDVKAASDIPKEISDISKIIDKDGYVYAGTKVRHISGGPIMSILGFYKGDDISESETCPLYRYFMYKKIFVNVFQKSPKDLGFFEEGGSGALFYFFRLKRETDITRYDAEDHIHRFHIILEFWDESSSSLKHCHTRIDQLELA